MPSPVKNKATTLAVVFCLLCTGASYAQAKEENALNASADTSDVISPKMRPKPPPVAAAESTRVTPTVTALKQYVLRQGEAIHSEMQAWAKAEGWTLNWKLAKSWRIPAGITISAADCSDAVNQVITGLYEEGKPVKLSGNKGNMYMEVVSNEVR